MNFSTICSTNPGLQARQEEEEEEEEEEEIKKKERKNKKNVKKQNTDKDCGRSVLSSGRTPHDK